MCLNQRRDLVSLCTTCPNAESSSGNLDLKSMQRHTVKRPLYPLKIQYEQPALLTCLVGQPNLAHHRLLSYLLHSPAHPASPLHATLSHLYLHPNTQHPTVLNRRFQSPTSFGVRLEPDQRIFNVRAGPPALPLQCRPAARKLPS